MDKTELITDKELTIAGVVCIALSLLVVTMVFAGCNRRPDTENTPRTPEEIRHFSYEDNFRNGFVEREDGVYLVKKLPRHITMIDGKFYDLSESEVSIQEVMEMEVKSGPDGLETVTNRLREATAKLHETLEELKGTSDSLNKPATQDDE